tara:strand:- start:51 stop:173 length:123 start_codon:yes stop_codon:yes gene_type:complete
LVEDLDEVITRKKVVQVNIGVITGIGLLLKMQHLDIKVAG